MKNGICIFIFLFLIFSEQSILAQNFDSLKVELKNAKHDTIKARLLVKLSDACEIEDIQIYTTQAIELCERNLKELEDNSPLRPIFYKYLAAAYNNVGYDADQHGEVPKALEYYNKSLKIQEDIKDEQGIAYSLNNIGYIFLNQNDVFKALEYFHRSLKIQEKIHDKYGIAVSMINIGNIYKDNGNMPKAFEYFEKSLKIKKEINDKEGIAISLLNIGYIYYVKGNSDKALDYFNQGYKLYEQIDDRYGIGYASLNIGHVYEEKGEVDKALIYYKKSLEIQRETEDKVGIARALNYLASAMLKKGNTNKALQYAKECLKLSKELGYPEPIKFISETLSKIYAKTGNYKEAFEMHQLFKQMSDTLRSMTNKKMALQKSFQYEYDKKTSADSIKVAAERNVFDAKLKQGKTQRTALYLGIAIIALFSAFMYNRFRVTRKQKQIIEIQKTEVEQQRQLADERRVVAEDQKHIIEEKQKEILDSIHYAKRIQQAMLTSEEYITTNFSQKNEVNGRDYFIFYQPKDIVSGDFYWALSHHGKFYVAAADCTGHGVPGAFMSLLNISFLNANVIESGFKEPAAILNEQRKEIIKALNPTGTENSKDGMDCVLCAFDLATNNLQFALANNPLWIIRNNELIEIKGDKMPVGKYDENTNDFTAHTMDLQKGDVVYLLTDGYADQFGGNKGKKFKYRHLKDLLLTNVNRPMAEQKETLSKTINDWKSNLEQVDDILIIGVRV